MSSASAHYILGAGRWGTWLARRLQQRGFTIHGVLGRRASARALALELGVQLLDEPAGTNAIVWVCVGDAQIDGVARQALAWTVPDARLVHASGAHPVDVAGVGFGVLWPLQSISAALAPDWAHLPFVVQASDQAFAKTIYRIAERLSGRSPRLVTSTAQRQRLHLAATLTQNFANLLWTLSDEVLAQADLDYRELLPLLESHLNNLSEAPPAQLQTGPAARGDQITLACHRELLTGHADALEVYDVLTRILRERFPS